MKRDLYAEVSARIVAELERGAAPWIKSWSATPGANTPCNAVSNRPYSGCNVILLWMTQAAGYRTPRFMTFKQALELRGNVRKGERGTKVYFVKQLQVRDQGVDDGTSRVVPMLREYTVFNVDQCDNLPDCIITGKPMRVRNPDARDELADDFLHSTGADIREGHGEAMYVPSRDFISMPAFAAFKGADSFYNVAFHELTHYADLRIMPRRCRSCGQVSRVSARHVGIIGLTEQAVVVPGSESNGTGILGEACGRSARVFLAAVSCQTIVGISGAGRGPAVLGAAEQSTLVTQTGRGTRPAASR